MLRNDTWRQKEKGKCQRVTLPGSGDPSAMGERRQWGELKRRGALSLFALSTAVVEEQLGCSALTQGWPRDTHMQHLPLCHTIS